MAARTPRRTFARPFVVTLAAAPACFVSTAPPQQQPRPVEEAPQTDPARPTGVVMNPPRPQPPVQQEEHRAWTVFKTKDGCAAAIKVECPPNVMCNPPPPVAYKCPEGLSVDQPIVVETQGGVCVARIDGPAPSCPPHAACNPPRPRTVPCPTP